MPTNCSAPYCRPFRVSAGLFEYIHTPRTRSTKPFAKRLSRCRDKWTCISVFFALCSPTAQTLTMVRFAWSWARSDTFLLRENAPQNRLRNGWAVVELSEVVFSHFLPYAHPLLSHLPSSVLCDLGLDQIPPHSTKTLPKTVHETAEPL